ncbi:Protein CBG03303 [Caenorhabditis briggsae]|uniref:Protein CBG03303 n=2 Tax=Caenorhabditis briggsae TaxID=6238 RepID=A8WSC4_CAEBR|nr:Protein CBG03303 [Caenorhabditis briggsae]ULU05476.1 hypothetical protein L3Y34_017860 [Caenorhabditis briggsae]CAP23383.1 Protein CBG03303 [Caenorhabditis briggsae]
MSQIENPPDWLKSEKVNVLLMNFIAEKANESLSLLNISKICKEFKQQIYCDVSEKNLHSRIRNFRLRIHELEDLDNDTKVRMLFVLSAPVDSGFLIELRKDAEVEFDDVYRITKYQKKDGTLTLIREQIPPVRQFDTRSDKSLLKFLAVMAEEQRSPVSDTTFVTEFRDVTESEKSVQTFKERYTLIKRQIYLSTEYDIPTRIKMMFVSSTRLHSSILAELRQSAYVEVDNKSRITHYMANDGSLELKGNHVHPRSSGIENHLSDSDVEMEEKHAIKREVIKDLEVPASKRKRISTKRFSPEEYVYDVDDMGFENDRHIQEAADPMMFSYDSENYNGEQPRRHPKDLMKKSSLLNSIIETEERKLARVHVNPLLAGEKNMRTGIESGLPTSSNLQDPNSKHQDMSGPLTPVARMSNSDRQEYRDIFRADPSAFNNILNFVGDDSRASGDLEINETVANDSPRRELSSDGLQTVTRESVSPPSDNVNNFPVKKVLEWLRIIILSLDSYHLELLEIEVDIALTTIKDESKMVSLQEILSTLRNGVHIVTRNCQPISSSEETTNLNDYLLNLHTSLFIITSPSVAVFQNEIKKIRKNVEVNRQIPIQCIRPTLETIYLLAFS